MIHEHVVKYGGTTGHDLHIRANLLVLLAMPGSAKEGVHYEHKYEHKPAGFRLHHPQTRNPLACSHHWKVQTTQSTARQRYTPQGSVVNKHGAGCNEVTYGDIIKLYR